MLREVGGPGQAALKRARVLVVGAGGLGAPALLYLAAAGVGTLGIIDDDAVALSNLQRQVIHATPAIGEPKVVSAAAAIRRLNPHVTVEPHRMRLVAANALDLLGGYDLVADGSDNFATRYLVSDACFFRKKPLVTAAVGIFDGTLTTIRAHERDLDGKPNPSYRCLFPEPPPPGTVPACAEAGILGALTGVLGSLMALEVIRELVGFGEGLVGRLVMFDARSMRFERCNTAGTPPTRFRASSQRLRICQPTDDDWLLRPRGDHGGALHYRPFVVAGSEHPETIGFGSLPGGTEAVIGELPGAFAFGAGLGHRLTRHLAVGGEHHFELDIRGRRRSERLSGEERCLDVLRRKLAPQWRALSPS